MESGTLLVDYLVEEEGTVTCSPVGRWEVSKSCRATGVSKACRAMGGEHVLYRAIGEQVL